MKHLTILAALIIAVIFTACDKDVEGCTNPNSTNYNPEATVDNGSCIIPGCTDPSASNYDPNATDGDGTCIYVGCTDPLASNYDPQATEDSGNCIYPGCTDVNADQYDATANEDDGSCSTYFDRWTGTFAGDFECEGLLDQFFGDAEMTFSKVEEADNLDSMEVFIEFSLATIPLNFGSTITRDSMYAFGFFEGVMIDSIDIIPTVEDEVFDITMQGVLGIMEDNQSIEGTLTINIKETSSGLNFEATDRCEFIGNKQ